MITITRTQISRALLGILFVLATFILVNGYQYTRIKTEPKEKIEVTAIYIGENFTSGKRPTRILEVAFKDAAGKTHVRTYNPVNALHIKIGQNYFIEGDRPDILTNFQVFVMLVAWALVLALAVAALASLITFLYCLATIPRYATKTLAKFSINLVD